MALDFSSAGSGGNLSPAINLQSAFQAAASIDIGNNIPNFAPATPSEPGVQVAGSLSQLNGLVTNSVMHSPNGDQMRAVIQDMIGDKITGPDARKALEGMGAKFGR